MIALLVGETSSETLLVRGIPCEGFLAGAALERSISPVVYGSDIQHLAAGLARLPDLVSALLVTYSKDMI